MKKYYTFILLALFFNSCIQTAEKQTANDKRIIGQWNTDSCSIGIIHGVIKSPLTDISGFLKHRITNRFFITFKEDSSFTLQNENGPTEIGIYKITKNASSLTLNQNSHSWITFNIDSITDSTLFLTSRYIPFYSIDADSVSIFRGENINLILNRK
jgi:hypothetical protein